MPFPEHWNFSDFPEGLENHPVVGLDLKAILAYCKWAGKRLATEAEWEKAASWDPDSRRKVAYPWGNEFSPARCNSSESGKGGTTPVSAFPEGASPLGVMDMAGNVWELCWDYFDRNFYRRSPKSDPTGPRSGRMRVARGGDWNSSETQIRCTHRQGDVTTLRLNNRGFRCVCDGAGS